MPGIPIRPLRALCVLLMLAPAAAHAQSRNDGTFDPAARQPLAQALQDATITPAQRLRLKPKYRIRKDRAPVPPDQAVPGMIVVKFVDGARVRALNPRDLNTKSTDKRILDQRLETLVSRQRLFDDADLTYLKQRGLDRDAVRDEMGRFRRIVTNERIQGWERLHPQPLPILAALRARAELRTGRRASDLANYYWIKLRKDVDPQPVLDRMNALRIVEQAYLMPQSFEPDIPPATPDFTGNQGYLRNDSNGIYAAFAHGVPGGKGDLVRIIDIESGWNLSHEDLPSFSPLPDPNEAGNDHGTGVMGVLVARDDGAGVKGIVPNAAAGMVSKNMRTGFGTVPNLSSAILEGSIQLRAGDVLLLEAQSGGPRGVDCTCETGDGGPRDQCGLVPIEWSDNVYDAIVAAVSSGVIVVEAAGNGEQDLDDAIFDGKFNRAQRDSGALIVAASEDSRRERKCFSNHGARIDLHGWGENVMTTGYGEPDDSFRINGLDRDQWYRSTFNGTSSASPIVAGAAVALQGVQFANNNPPLNWLEMRQLLRDTGTPPAAGHDIGPLPNLEAAIAVLDPPTPPDAVYESEIALGDFTDAAAVAGLSTGNASQRREIGGGGPFQAIERIMFAERGDRPCYLRVEKAHILDNVRGPRRLVDECGSRGHTDRSVKYVPTLTTSHDTFIRKVAVCNSRTNNHPARLKGIRVWRSRVDPDGTLFPLPGEITQDRTNCDDNWRTPSECPADSIAARVEVHLRADGDDLSVSGLRLICREVQVNRTCIENCP